MSFRKRGPAINNKNKLGGVVFERIREFIGRHTHIPFNIVVIVVIAVVALLTIYLVINYIIGKRRYLRQADLRHDIDMILEANGCENAWRHFVSAKHIHTFYGIPLSECGYSRSIYYLEQEARNSYERYSLRVNYHIKSDSPVYVSATSHI